VNRHRFGHDLAAELPARQAALVTARENQEWLLPAGSHYLPAGLDLGAEGVALTLAGQPGTELRLSTGILRVRGSRVEIRNLAILAEYGAGALDVVAGDVLLDRVSAMGGRADEPGSALAVIAGHSARLNHCSGSLRRGTEGAGVKVKGTLIQLTGVRGSAVAQSAIGIEVRATEKAVLADCAASGVRATSNACGIRACAPVLEATGLATDDLAGSTCNGLELYSPGPAGLLALGVSATNLEARSGFCQGVLALSGGSLKLSGFVAETLSGNPCQGVTALGAVAVELESGRAVDIRGSGGGAGGLRVLTADGRASLSVRDIAVEAVGGTAPRAEARPPEAFAAWARQAAAALALEPFDAGAIPLFPASAADEVAGLHVGAALDVVAWSRGLRPGTVDVEAIRLHRIAGTALQLEAGLRAARLGRAELWSSARAGWVQAEQLQIAGVTVHRHLEPLRVGPGEVEVLNSLFSGTPGGAAPIFDPETQPDRIAAAYANGATAPWQALPSLPYRDPGPASVPPSLAQGIRPPRAEVNLELAADAALPSVALAGDTEPPHVGAHPPALPSPCHMEDPERGAWRPPATPEPPPPPADYRARDAKSLLRLMLDRARTSMPSWSEGGPSDFTQMLLELLAERMDHLAYSQERAVAEGFLDIARLRRSVEDHARTLDYEADPGLSATAMIRFQIDHGELDRAADKLASDSAAAAADLLAALSDGRPLDIPSGTLVGNADPGEASILFATESTLTYRAELEAVPLAETCPMGATFARLQGRLAGLDVGRWVVLSRGRAFPGHLVRVTSLDLETDATVITWDPRRPTRHIYPAEPQDGGEAAVAFGNVVPGHHGLPVRVLTDAEGPDAMLAPWQALLATTVDGEAVREVEVPLSPVSVQGAGYPLPGEPRRGNPVLRVVVDGEEWRRVDDLSLAGPGDEVYALRAGGNGRPVLRFGDGRNGSALPQRKFPLRMDLAVGLGSAGNVGAYTLNRLVRFGPVGSDMPPPASMLLDAAGPERDDLVRALWRVTNPLPGVGGRDPESLDRIRYRAPLQVRDALSAVTPGDYERLLLRLPFVAGARARVAEAGVRHLVRVTVLLRDEDTLAEAELLRRWAEVRRRLEEIRMLGFDVEAVPPTWVPLDIDLVVDAASTADPGQLREAIEECLAGNGGLLDPDGAGLGGDVHLSDVYQSVQRVRGVQAVRVKRFRRLEPQARERLGEGVIPVGDHEVASLGGPRKPGLGLLTVSVCGGLQ
jgi:hypothetical protein